MAMTKYREGNRAKWIGVRPAHNGEQIIKHGDAVNTLVVLHTVAAGKTFYLFNTLITHSLAVGGGYSTMTITNAADVIQHTLYRCGLGINWLIVLSQCRHIPVEVQEGWKVKILSANINETLSVTIEGIEE